MGPSNKLLMVNIYLDTCAWGRPFDDQDDKRIREETTAFFEIAWGIDMGEIEVVGSDVLFAELEDIADGDKSRKVRLLVAKAISSAVKLDETVKDLALEIEDVCRSRGADSLHIASAIIGGVEFLVTTDDGLLKKGGCIKQKFKIDVINPINFLRNLHE